MKCPVCGCIKFYVKDPEDEYEIYEFECRDGVIRFESDVSDSEIPEVGKETETFCNNCAWHDKFKKISKKGD
ncbi:MAG: hypothetical protein PVG86_09090 [Desulfobacterales bacterium]|jgi:hypothetical protein